MKFRIKALDDRIYHELEKFKELGYKVIQHNEHFIQLKSYDKNNVENKEIELYFASNQAIKYDIKNMRMLDPFTKEELKILDTYNWDLHDYMKHPVGQDVTDWVEDDEN